MTAAIDTDAFAEMKDIMGEAITEVIETFLNTVPEQIDKLEAAIKEGHSEQVFDIAHRMKSSGSSIGALGFAEAAADIEQVARQGTTENTSALLQTLKSKFDEVAEVLKAELA